MEMSLDALMESEGVRGDELSDPTSMDGFTQVEMDLLIDLLSPKHRVIIHMLYVERFSQRQVAQQLGVSQALVSRWHRQALDRLGRRIGRDATD
jgi:DNA-directed RNA polymerase specialized sigma subunit